MSISNFVRKQGIKFGNHVLTIETGVIAKQATSSVIVDLDGTTVLVTVVGVNSNDDEKGFFPLRVDYQERSYANGKIPGGFFKREGRQSEREILISRLIDRPLRPLFPKYFCCEVQIVATVISINPQVESDIVAMIGASCALRLSGIPFHETMASVRVGYKGGMYVLNPTISELESSKLNLIVAGTKTSVLMVESDAKELSEEVMLGAIIFGHQQFQPVVKLIDDIVSEVGKPTWDWTPPLIDKDLIGIVKSNFSNDIYDSYLEIDKTKRNLKLKTIYENIHDKIVNENLEESITEKTVQVIIDDVEKSIIRNHVLSNELRIDGRNLTTVRPIVIDTGFLSRTHGSSVFTRGETQAIVTVTLGTNRDAQVIDSPFGEYKNEFILHYNFPPYCTGETGMVGSPKRREIGHGYLARRAVQSILPEFKTFPYVIRVVSEITESNGSSSMASICGSSLALMDAGVPIKSHVAGIAMGLIKECDKFVVITDILGDEDHLGDMDFKVAGTRLGITALQMDIKILGVTKEIMSVALEQAHEGRMHILNEMEQVINYPKETLSDFAPRITTFKISPDKIKNVIGKGGSTIRSLTENVDVTVEIKDDGSVQIASNNKKESDYVKSQIEKIISDIEVGTIYEGKVVRIVDFGAFINILPGKDGLLHISQIADHRVSKVSNELSEGQIVKVKVLEIDRQGKIRLSMKDVK